MHSSGTPFPPSILFPMEEQAEKHRGAAKKANSPGSPPAAPPLPCATPRPRALQPLSCPGRARAAAHCITPGAGLQHLQARGDFANWPHPDERRRGNASPVPCKTPGAWGHFWAVPKPRPGEQADKRCALLGDLRASSYLLAKTHPRGTGFLGA